MVFQLDKVSGQKIEVEAARNGKDWGLTGGRQSGGRESKSSRVVPKVADGKTVTNVGGEFL